MKTKLSGLKERARGVRLIATDLDGTLFDSKHELLEENRFALETLTARGIKLVAATGRSRSSIPDSITKMPGMNYLITANGAKVYISGTDELILEKYISVEAMEYVLPLFSDPDVMCEVFWGGVPHVEESRYNAARDYGVPRWFTDYFFRSRQPVSDYIPAVRAHIHEAENINFVFGNEKTETRLRNFLNKRTDLYELTSSFPFNFEIGGVGVTKAAALAVIAERENLDPKEIIAFGDQLNDVKMIEFAGIGIAPANAVPEALAAADLITVTNNENAIATALKKLNVI